ncbi:sulfatase [Pontibacter sp. G13]|uniref:sulfatase family protein n=1 Tax=Pontibacter sp. G13 TaxID=3074898 RepID=UPI00288A7385|nr:sulfatase [Pontibacter sp. G13]WNJ20652.1 sulfatase [Pontibacter sp. G13]
MLSRLLLSIFLFGMTLSFAQSQRPNVVFILADDCTKFDLGCYGSPDSKTPTIDQLAAGGMQFNRCYQAAPMCSPTRHSIFTGLYPARSGAYPNHTYAEDDVQSVVQYLNPLGYRVGLTGKTHIAPKSIFDFEYLDDKHVLIGPETEAFLSSASENEENFCLFVCSNEPHTPWNQGDPSQFDPVKITLPEMYADLPRIREEFCKYLAEINYLDGQVKQTLDALDKYGLRENTVIIFASEQGNSFPFAKWTCYQAGLGSALIVNWPASIQAGLTSEALVEYTDILPTIIDLAGGEPVDHLDGQSLLPLLKQETDTHKSFTYGMQTTRGIINGAAYYPIRSVAGDTFRLVWNISPEMAFRNVVSEKKWFKEWLNSPDAETRKTANLYIHRPEFELYNDVTDPYNRQNLIDQPEYADKVKALKAELHRWMEHCGDLGLETELHADVHKNRGGKGSSQVKGNAHTVVMGLQASRPSGNLQIEVQGYYSFSTKKDCEVFVDGIQLIWPTQNSKLALRRGVIGLETGHHTLEIKSNGPVPQLSWSGPNFQPQVMPQLESPE